MTFDSMMSFIGQLATVYVQANPERSDAAGIPQSNTIPEVVNGVTRTVLGRFKKLSQRQVDAWASLGVEADYDFITKDATIQNGRWLLSSDGRMFEVKGTGGNWYEAGTIPQHSDYPVKESRRA